MPCLGKVHVGSKAGERNAPEGVQSAAVSTLPEHDWGCSKRSTARAGWGNSPVFGQVRDQRWGSRILNPGMANINQHPSGKLVVTSKKWRPTE